MEPESRTRVRSGGQEEGGLEAVRRRTLAFVERNRLPEGGPGAYRYSDSVAKATLYSSTYAAMTRSLYGDLDRLPQAERTAWVEYLNSHQDDDGLFRDPLIFGQGWYSDDPLWCGRAHLSCHVVTALACLGGAASKPFAWLCRWHDPDRMVRWLEARDWGGRVATSGNEIMNVGTLLQYSRDVHGDLRAGEAVGVLLEWLSTNHVSPETGVWGGGDISDAVARSHAVQAAYHWWPLFFYDGVAIPYLERAIDTVLATRNPAGGFGWGVHNPTEPLKSSACEDIDSIDPLCRMMRRTTYRRDAIRAALSRAYDWVLTNQASDGGFVFVRDRVFEYGHPELRGDANRGAMFPTWFRTLSLALIGKALSDHRPGRIAWEFARCPGYQFWGVANEAGEETPVKPGAAFG